MRISDWSSDVCSSDLGFDGWRHGHAFPSCTKGLTGRAGGLKSIVLAIPDRFPAKVDLSVPVGCLPDPARKRMAPLHPLRSEEHTSELQSLMRISYAVFCLKKKNHSINTQPTSQKQIITR